ncbi:AraC family transcriptional regulator, partial [Microbacterium testaceum]
MRSVAVVIQPGFAPFEFGLACEAFGLDRTDDGIPNFDFRIVTPDPGVVPSNIGFSVNVERGLDAAADADIVILSPIPREQWASVDPRVIEVVRAAHARG